MPTPFFKVSIRQDKIGALEKDISDIISRFSYEDAVDVDNMLTLEIKRNGLLTLNDKDIQEGSIVSFYWGYSGGKQSQKFTARIANVLPDYDDVVTATYQATDLGLQLKKNTSKKDWKGNTSSQIVQTIANFYGLTAYVDKTDKIWDFMPQGGRTDFEFLRYLASIEKNGSMRFYMRSGSINFTRIKLENESVRTFTYNDGDGELISFRPKSRETTKSNAARDTVVTSVDPFTNKVVQKTINDGNAKDDNKLGQYGAHIYNADGAQVAVQKGKRPSQVQAAQNDLNRAGKHISTADNENAEDIGNSIKKRAAMDEYIADIETIGDPLILSDMIITIDGVATRDSGNWFATRTKHVIDSGGGYKLLITANKNATKKPNSDIQDNVNSTSGPKESETKKKVGKYIYNEDAIEISSPKTNNTGQ